MILEQGRLAGGLLCHRQNEGNWRPNGADQEGQIGFGIRGPNVRRSCQDDPEDQQKERRGPDPSNQQHHAPHSTGDDGRPAM